MSLVLLNSFFLSSLITFSMFAVSLFEYTGLLKCSFRAKLLNLLITGVMLMQEKKAGLSLISVSDCKSSLCLFFTLFSERNLLLLGAISFILLSFSVLGTMSKVLKIRFGFLPGEGIICLKLFLRGILLNRSKSLLLILQSNSNENTDPVPYSEDIMRLASYLSRRSFTMEIPSPLPVGSLLILLLTVLALPLLDSSNGFPSLANSSFLIPTPESSTETSRVFLSVIIIFTAMNPL
mmetsp:Transcript_8189/g.8458  ORF Transcript_8189/g.8458 Transcript_8189/m.8458 type:complete len:236 (+) Transcript_8189:1173-1880(+)